MAKKTHQVSLILSNEAQGDLDLIWDWNSETYGIERANRYLEFLHREMSKLSTRGNKSRVVATRPDLRSLLIRKRSRGHGHVAIYKIDGDIVKILHIFHTAQDWENHLE